MKGIKLFIPALLCTALAASCGTVAETMTKEEAKAVQSAISGRDFVIDISAIYPQYGMAVMDSGYSLELKDGHLTTRLPFIGSSDYGAMGDISIHFDKEKVVVSEEKGNSKDGRTLKFSAGHGNGRCDFRITISKSGFASIQCTSPGRSAMSYNGQLRY